jgi:hypothetical protein
LWGEGIGRNQFFINIIILPLTLTLSPLVGRGDWKEFIFD